jgi:hypothetical protein
MALITGSRKKDTVFDSSANGAFWHDVELRAGSGRHFAVTGFSQEGAVDRCWPACILISLSLDYFFGAETNFQPEPKSFYLGN